MTITEKVKTLMETLNVSISELARRMETSKQNLSYKLKQETLTVKDLQAIADALGVQVQVTFIIPERTSRPPRRGRGLKYRVSIRIFASQNVVPRAGGVD